MTWSLLADTWPVIALAAFVVYAPIWRRRYVERRRRDYDHSRPEEGRQP